MQYHQIYTLLVLFDMCKVESCPCLDHEATKATFYHLNALALITKAFLPFKDLMSYGVQNDISQNIRRIEARTTYY